MPLPNPLTRIFQETLDPEFRPFVRLLEYDSRFSVFKEFVYYDYQQPLKLPGRRLEDIFSLGTLTIAVELKGQFDRVIIDPPFLSHDCHSKGKPYGNKRGLDHHGLLILALCFLNHTYCLHQVLMTVNWLLNASPLVPASKERPERRMAVCTGETMQETVLDLYEEYGVRETTYVPQHAAGLANEFKCFANFTCKSWELTAS